MTEPVNTASNSDHQQIQRQNPTLAMVEATAEAMAGVRALADLLAKLPPETVKAALAMMGEVAGTNIKR